MKLLAIGEGQSPEYTIDDSEFRTTVLATARAFDDDRWVEALDHLRAAPLCVAGNPERLVAAALWERILKNFSRIAPGRRIDEARVLDALEVMAATISNRGRTWEAVDRIDILEEELGVVDASAIVATVFWGSVLDGETYVFERTQELFYRAGDMRCAQAFEHYLALRDDYIPGNWAFILFVSSKGGSSIAESPTAVLDFLEKRHRSDLAPLFVVYWMMVRQAPVEEISMAALALKTPAQRSMVAGYLAAWGCMNEDFPDYASLYFKLAANDETRASEAMFMKARLANVQGRWADVLDCAVIAGQEPKFRIDASILRAIALARTSKNRESASLLDSVLADPDANHIQKSRASFVHVSNDLARLGLPAFQDMKRRAFPDTPGRPLAQSLWVGKRLRWIERLAIKSFLDRGWRFQLYAYDDPDNVPDGCEVLDASVIIPAREVFREGADSGLHAGSVGAFSDLFRYKLLFERGGLWVDTDVVNFGKFDSDGCRFVSTEVNEAGIIGLNGAIMAAPARDELMGVAYERAKAILAGDERMYFTRIGPCLLAELIHEQGSEGLEFMPPGFLGPVSWMNTGLLLQPYEKIMARADFKAAANLHVYTETWRIFGLGLDRPPPPETFLGRLYRDHLGVEADSKNMSKS